MIELIKQIPESSNIVWIASENQNNISLLPQSVQPMAKRFVESQQTQDFYKVEDFYCFFVKEQEDQEKMRLAGHTIRTGLNSKANSLTFVGNTDKTLAVVEGLLLSNYQFLKYFKDAQQKAYALKSVGIVGDFTAKQLQDLQHAIESVYWARDMVNEPTSFLTATELANQIQTQANQCGISVEVMDLAQIKKLNMGGLLAVNKGSVQEPTFTILEYKPKDAVNKAPIVLVGKGVVYDTGGLSLKPTAGSMDSMKSDMGGAACMAGTIFAAAKNKLNVHVIALIPATDNRPGGDAYAPGDVITMYDGTTVEVLNTDAEGRMILADAISYANAYNPEVIIDAATLTGAALVVAGDTASCIMGNDQKTMDGIIASGYAVHERLAQLPFWDDYKDLLKSNIADMKNIGGKMAGTVTAGKFLEHFAKHPYVHIDIAGPAWMDSPRDYKGVGGTGTGVRTLLHYLTNYTGE